MTVDCFGYPTDQDKKGEGPFTGRNRIFIGERSLVSLWVLEANSTCLNVILTRSQECVARVWRKRTQCSPSSKKLHVKRDTMEWSKTIVTDAQDVHDKVSTKKGRLPQQKALTLEISTIREWLVNSGALIRWTADENMIMNGLTKDQKESRQHLARVLQNGECSVQRDATLVRAKSTSQSKPTRRTKPDQTSTRPSPEELHDKSNIVENERK